ncbi:MAG: hypothetical protein WB421_17370 [Terriglobales bacterium]
MEVGEKEKARVFVQVVAGLLRLDNDHARRYAVVNNLCPGVPATVTHWVLAKGKSTEPLPTV